MWIYMCIYNSYSTNAYKTSYLTNVCVYIYNSTSGEQRNSPNWSEITVSIPFIYISILEQIDLQRFFDGNAWGQ